MPTVTATQTIRASPSKVFATIVDFHRKAGVGQPI